MSDKIQFNGYLDKKSVDIVKDFLKDTGLSFSVYCDLMIRLAVQRIEESRSVSTEESPHHNILHAYEVLGLLDLIHNQNQYVNSAFNPRKSGQKHE